MISRTWQKRTRKKSTSFGGHDIGVQSLAAESSIWIRREFEHVRGTKYQKIAILCSQMCGSEKILNSALRFSSEHRPTASFKISISIHDERISNRHTPCHSLLLLKTIGCYLRNEICSPSHSQPLTINAPRRALQAYKIFATWSVVTLLSRHDQNFLCKENFIRNSTLVSTEQLQIYCNSSLQRMMRFARSRSQSSQKEKEKREKQKSQFLLTNSYENFGTQMRNFITLQTRRSPKTRTKPKPSK